MHHPWLIEGFEPDSQALDHNLIDVSAKLKFLVPLLHQLRSNGSKVLVFVEYRPSIDILTDVCRLNGFTYVTLDGHDTMKHQKNAIKKIRTKDKFTNSRLCDNYG